MFISIAVFFASVLIVILIWNEYTLTLKRFFEKEFYIRSEYSSQKLEQRIDKNIQSLSNLRDRIEFTNGEYFDFWSYDAQNILEQNPSFIFIEWIDSSMTIRKIEPLKGNEPALNLDISNVEYRREEWLKHKEDSSINITPWSEMTQGGYAFLVDAPIYYNGEFQGTITAGMNFTEPFDRLFEGMGNYAFNIKDEEGTEFYSLNETSDRKSFDDISYTHNIMVDTIDNQVWTLKVTPSKSDEDTRANMEGIVWLFLGVIISFLLSVLTYLFLNSVAETNRTKVVSQELMEANAALELEREKEQLASRSKTDFISTMSHEIRTPLNAIIGLIDILRDGHSTEKQSDYLEKMEMSSKSLLALVNDILEVDRIESGKTVFKREVFSPGEELSDICQLYKNEFESKGLYFDVEIDSLSASRVIGDSGKFRQIATNLFRNAYKFTSEGGVSVVLKSTKNNDKLDLHLTVTDTGIGIPEEEQQKIFHRFSQVDSGVERKYEGSGLGLSITRQLLELIQGSISVVSRVGEGAKFEVYVSYDLAADSPDVFDADQAEQRIEFPHARVLIAEDNQMNVFILKQTLEIMKIEYMTAGNGREAIDLIKDESFDLILMDVHMPEVDGFTATKELRKMGVETPIVALSANVTREAIEKAKEVGMNDYITKPFNRDRLLEIFNKFL
jgi:signal transduction histidine kinase/CheY-like chemotaxis protein